MGPLSSKYSIPARFDNRTRHEKCRESRRCTGPGCKVHTGKTDDKRKVKSKPI